MQFLYKLSKLLLFCLMVSFSAKAQYCAPTINSSGIGIIQINFATFNDVQNGQSYFTGINGYTQTTGSSSGIVKRYFGGSMIYSISNPGGSSKPYNFRVYADWNADQDFDDAGELCTDVSGTVPGISSTTTGTSIFPPLFLPSGPGNYRIRVAVSESGTATPCGSYTGEVEDYIITLPINTAPDINTSATVFMNPILATETNSNGISIDELVHSSLPGDTLITDANDRGVTYYDKVPRGIAVYDQNAPNGTWQYKVGNGAWTDFGSVSSGNCLLLMNDAGYTNYRPHSRIRFVPTGPGTPTFTFRAWDGTQDVNGSYGNIIATGGTTAYSPGANVASLQVLAPTSFTGNLYMTVQDSTIYSSVFDRAGATIGNPEPLMNDSIDYYAYDLELDATNNKIYWVAGSSSNKIASAKTNGTSQQLNLITGLNYVTGLAVHNDKIYFLDWAADYSSVNIYRADTSGNNITLISGGAGQFNGTGAGDIKDIEYYNNKIYFQYADNSYTYHIASVNASDGTGFTDLYSTANYFGGLAVANDTLYWTENNSAGNPELNRVHITGGTVEPVVAENGRTFNDLFVDPQNSQVYYLDADNNNPNYTLLRRVATSGGTATTLSTVSGIANSFAFENSLSVLPVVLTDFNGQFDAMKKTSMLEWNTSSENHSGYYIVERSLTGNNFVAIDTIAASGLSYISHHYQYNDDVTTIQSDKFYYRLKQVDMDGRFKYSQIVLLSRNADGTLVKISPNPGRGNYIIQLEKAPLSAVVVNTYNSNGKLVANAKFNAQQYNLNLQNQLSGVYYVELQYANGTKKRLTIVKQ